MTLEGDDGGGGGTISVEMPAFEAHEHQTGRDGAPPPKLASSRSFRRRGGAADADGSKTKAKTPIIEAPPIGFWSFYFRYADPVDSLLMFLGAVGGVVTGALIPYFQVLLGNMIDSLNTGTSVVSAVTDIAVMFAYLSLVAFVSGTLQVACWGANGERQTMRIRSLYVQSILKQDIAWFDLQTRGQTASMVSELTAQLQDGMGRKNGDIFEYLTQFIGGFVIAFTQSWRLTLVLIAVIPAIACSTALLAILTTRAQKKGSIAYAAAGAKAYEALASIRTVQSLGIQERGLEGYETLLRQAEKMGYSKARDSGLGIGILGLVMYCSFGLAFYYGSRLVAENVGCDFHNSGCMTGGKVMACFFSVIMGAMGLGSAFPCFTSVVSGKAAAAQIFAVIARKPSIDSSSDKGVKPQHVRGEIELREVTFAYPTRPDRLIARNFNLKIEAGKTLALVGPSGEGKSTTMSLVLRLYDPAAGQVLLDGIPYTDINIKALRSHIGYVGQEPTLFGGSIRENIKSGKEGATDEEMISAAKQANCHDFISSFPDGYDTYCGEGGVQLSGGQRQRIAIARAIIKDPEVLLLDEATSALDNRSEKIVQAALDRLQEIKRRTTIVIAHRLTTIRNADVIAFVKGGQVQELGSHEELMAVNGEYAKLVTMHEAHAEAPAKVEEEVPSMFERRSDETGSDTSLPQQQQEEETGVVLHTAPLEEAIALGNEWGIGRRRSSFGRRGSRASSQHSIGETGVSAVKHLERKGTVLTQLTNVEDIVPSEPGAKPIKAGKLLWGLALEEWDAFLLGLIGSIVNGCGFPLLGFLIARMQKVLYYRDASRIRSEGDMWGGLFCVLGVIVCCARIAQEYGLGVMSERLARKLRSMAFRAMLRREISWFDKSENSTGALTTQLAEDASRVNGVLGSSLGQLLQLIFCLGLALALAFTASWQMAALVLGTLPLNIVGRMVSMQQMRGQQGASADSGGAAGAVLSASVLGIRTVAAFSLEESMHTKFLELYNQTFATRMREAWVNGALLGYTQVVSYGTNGLIFYVAGVLISKGDITFVEVMQAMYTLMLGTSGVAMALKGLGDSRSAGAGAHRIASLIWGSHHQTIDCESTTSGETLHDVRGEVTFEDIQFHYPSRPEHQIYGGRGADRTPYNLKLEAGETVALVGPSGGGKSTSMQLLLRFYDPQGGRVLLDGADIRHLNVKWLRSQMSYVGQEPQLFVGTIRENVLNGKLDATEEQLISACKAACIHEFIVSLPEGYNTKIEEGSTNLSGGQKQRIAIARAVIGDPKILLLDEATSALDNENERKVQEALENMQALKRRTTLVIAHRLTTIQKSDKIAVVSNGGVAELGKHDQLMALNGIYANLVKQKGGEAGTKAASIHAAA